jgi:NAD(P)-dependent dehydrogenase (short-subunit alcohol dehydrogenase family)
MSGRLEGKNTIITGAGAGVGRASALRFAEEGARVACADLDLERAQETVQLIVKNGGTALPIAADVAVEEDVVAMLEKTVTAFGSLDVLYNNAGIPTPRLGMALEDHSADDFQRLVAVNLGGVFYGCKHAVRRFKEQGHGGVILNTGSVAGLVGWGGSVYGATKGGVHLLTKAVAVEAAPFGIRVNAICPAGMPYTRFMEAGGMELSGDALDEAAKRLGASHPLGKPITAEDCAEAAVYLCSDAAINITGVLLPVDGGYVAR